ncbi:MerR family transcriptional regulator [Mammaliicoccus sciuri]|uniref:MerR family transcriptional regulator n=1 Tax=Mammaliicoccus sciuri TaxID=1296 RepID=UPI000CCFD508|nr:MerR family transcriptional regulator [Mammaliicoccus sciuri]MCD8799919.1 MerR family transcriptional regulator [Mammaliicoccus sciuri]MDT0711724.1 MerR family transcriptional regulator [Mammaliicoccus sciuri]MEB5759154.1 MerR family transcriptional regulator [Mammaliicoccus sciuri]MEB6255504.1 MerR family transcriptional regulator [Mammaliicoccus sciuri]MEB6301983.1 MerR family transcriptional regulator [Mammaliicoccus sciuri]
MEMTVKEIAQLVGISVRTLHHYDEINLLNPSNVSSSGYRLYSDENVDRLQQILFFKELDFPLKKIKEILDDPSFDKEEALNMHKKMLINKRTRIDQMIQTIDQTTKHMKGEINMTNEDKFIGFEFNQNEYEAEAREKWGNKTVDKANNRINSWSKEEKVSKEEEMNDIFRAFAENRNESPDSEIAQSIVQRWYTYLISNIDCEYSLEAFGSIGDMYVSDERFTKNINKFGDGTAQFASKAIASYVKMNQ